MKKFYFHIGLPKTGSTFLQKEIFTELKAVRYLGRPQYGLLSQRAKYDKTTLSRFFDRSPAVWSEMGDAFSEKLTRSITDEERSQYLVSDENAITGGIIDPYAIATHLKMMGSVLAQEGFIPFKLVLCIRRQDTWLASAYSETSARYPEASQREFEQRVERYLDPQVDYYRGPGVKLDYRLLYEHLEGAIGGKNILVLPFELLKADATTFMRKCLTFMEASSDLGNVLPKLDNAPKRNVKSVSEKSWLIKGADSLRREVKFEMRPGRLFSRFGLPRSIRFAFDGPEREDSILLPDSLSNRILNRYSESNKHLSDKLNLELS